MLALHVGSFSFCVASSTTVVHVHNINDYLLLVENRTYVSGGGTNHLELDLFFIAVLY